MTWPTARLGELCEINIGRTPSRSRQEYWGEGKPWLSIADMAQGRRIATTKEQITPLAVQEAVAKPVPAGTVLLSFKLSIGKVGISVREMFTNEAIAALPIRSGIKMEPDFLAWALEHRDWKHGSNRAAMGATLNKKSLAQIEVPVPPIEEQRRIAAILDHADSLRDGRALALESLNSLRDVVVARAMGYDTRGSVDLGDVAEVQGGLQVTSKRATNPREVTYLRVANVYRGRMDLAEIKSMRVTDKELERVRLQPNDLLLVEGHGNANEVGRAARWTETTPDTVHQNHLIRVRVDQSRLLPRVAEVLINSPLGQRHFARAGKTTSGLNTISVSNVRSLTLPELPMADQQDLAQQLERVASERARYLTHSAELGALFESLQSQAFAGEL